jgi:hypothetical protein
MTLADRIDDFEWLKVVNGWTFDPTREVWWARINKTSWRPESI